MRIFLNGIGAFGADVFARLRDAGHEIVAVAAPLQSLSGRPDRLRTAAEAASLPAFETARLGEPAVESALGATRPELGVMAFVQDIIPKRVLDLPLQGTIQYHPSLLPRHRGRSSINWAIIQGDKTTGATIFWPDEGLDTGPILLQREVEIGPDDTAGSLYYEKLYPMGIEMLVESVALVEQGRAPKQPQDESLATYERPCEGRLCRIDWRRPLAEVYNLIRGCEPSPGAWTRWNDRRLRVLEARPLPPLPGEELEPGVVGAVSDAGIAVGVAGGTIVARSLALEDAAAVPAQRIAAELGIGPGARFLNPSTGASAR